MTKRQTPGSTKEENRRLVVFADASVGNSDIGGWAAWLRRGDHKKGVFVSGPFQGRVYASHEAELLGLVNAVSIAHQRLLLADIDNVYLQCDNLWPLGRILHLIPGAVSIAPKDGKRDADVFPAKKPFRVPAKITDPAEIERVRERHARAEAILIEVFQMHPSITVHVKHVKGHHEDRSDGRSWVNRECDRLAGQHRRDEEQRRFLAEKASEISA